MLESVCSSVVNGEQRKSKNKMKSILLGKHHDVTAFSSKDPSRYVINSVHYSAKHKAIEAVDGRVCIRVPVIESDEFPPVKGQIESEPVDCIIEPEPFKKALANIQKSNIPVLEHARLDAHGKVTLTTTDLDCEQAVTSKPIEGTFPDIDQVIPTWEPVVKIRIAAEILSRIVEYAQKHAADDNKTVVLEFKSKDDPFRFSINIDNLDAKAKAIGAGMPVKLT